MLEFNEMNENKNEEREKKAHDSLKICTDWIRHNETKGIEK